jgi:hypothetical protein
MKDSNVFLKITGRIMKKKEPHNKVTRFDPECIANFPENIVNVLLNSMSSTHICPPITLFF